MARLLGRKRLENVGQVVIPSFPPGAILTDRDDGVQWTLIHDSTVAFCGIRNSTVNDLKKYRIYSANHGPVFPTEPKIRLLVRGGILGYEVEEDDRPKLARNRVFTSRNNARNSAEIREPIDTVFADGGGLAYVFKTFETGADI